MFVGFLQRVCKDIQAVRDKEVGYKVKEVRYIVHNSGSLRVEAPLTLKGGCHQKSKKVPFEVVQIRYSRTRM